MASRAPNDGGLISCSHGRPCDGFVFFSSRRRHTRYWRDWSSDVCSSDLGDEVVAELLDAWREVRLLATSRRPLGVPGEQVIPLPPLDVPTSSRPDEVEASEIGRAPCRERV